MELKRTEQQTKNEGPLDIEKKELASLRQTPRNVNHFWNLIMSNEIF